MAIIPCLNEEAHLEKIVQNLVRASQNLAMRIVIADGGSTDQTKNIALRLTQAHDNVHLLHNPQRIQSSGINLAVAEYDTDTDYIIRLDAHADYPDAYCQTLVNEAEAMQADAVVVAMHTCGKHRFQNIVAATQNSKLGNGGSAHRGTETTGKWVEHGHHALIRTPAFIAIGGYDETFVTNEDAELDLRLRHHGRKIWLTRKTILTYYPRATLRGLFRQYARYGYGRAQNVLKHHTMPKLRQMIPMAILPALLLSIATPLFWPAIIPIGIWAVFCLAYGAYLGIKAHDQLALALSGLIAMVMHLAWSYGFWQRMVRPPVRTQDEKRLA